MMWLRQIAQLSTTMSHAQRATAFHYRMLAGSYLDAVHLLCSYLFYFEALLIPFRACSSLGHLGLCRGSIGHVDVRHDSEMCMAGGECGEMRVDGRRGEGGCWRC